jgi:hypothetical protein
MPDISSQIVRINHTVFSWTSCRFLIDGQPWAGLVSVDYEEKRERKVVYAGRQDGTPLGWTAGKYSVPSFTMKFLKASWNDLTDYLTVTGLGSYGDATWNFLLQTVEPVIGAVPITRIGDPCVVIGAKEAHEEGIDELVTEVEVGCLAMLVNGKRLWSAVRAF